MASFVDIPDSDYEQRRHASELVSWINAKFRELEAGGGLEEQYFERRGLNIKRLIEEAVPLSRLGLFLWTPGNEPYLTLVPADRNFDGQVEVQGFNARSLKVEVTTLESEESTMRRQALAREGTVQLLGAIRRRGQTIISEPEMVDVAEQTARTVELALDRLRVKVESGGYDDTTAILVYLSEFWPLPAEGRFNLRMRTQQYIKAGRQNTSTVYYCYWPDYSVDSVEVFRPRLRSRGGAQPVDAVDKRGSGSR